MTNLHLQELIICRNILKDETLRCFINSLETPTNKQLQYEFASLLLEKAEMLSLSGNLLRSYLLYLLTHDENIVSKVMEMSAGKAGNSLKQIFFHDVEILLPLFVSQPSAFITTKLLDNYNPTEQFVSEAEKVLNETINDDWSANSVTEALLSYYAKFGYGDIAVFRAFSWNDDKTLLGIQHFDPMRLNDIIGYEKQKEQLTANTAAFLAGKPANNVLLVGARGTGKSSAVKALANEYFSQGLRLVQLTKQQLVELPLIMKALRKFASKKFIIFLDDLSFEGFETEYKHLKSAIEGGVEAKPANVLIYATSNRRHLIKETWRDREDGQDELYKNDSINETISLSDRFGLIINYRMPNQDEYIAIIDHYLRKDGVELDKEELRVLGHRWEIEHSGRTGRTARQFVDHYLGQNK